MHARILIRGRLCWEVKGLKEKDNREDEARKMVTKKEKGMNECKEGTKRREDNWLRNSEIATAMQ
jgi:hypothetical protein